MLPISRLSRAPLIFGSEMHLHVLMDSIMYARRDGAARHQDSDRAGRNGSRHRLFGGLPVVKRLGGREVQDLDRPPVRHQRGLMALQRPPQSRLAAIAGN